MITVIGFFASLRFYREGVELQTRVRELLSRVDEKVASVQSQVGGMFEKTLDAVIGRSAPQTAAEEQRRLLKAAETSAQAPAPDAQAVPQAQPNLAAKVTDYYAFRQLRFTDVSTGDARAIFQLGAPHGFNLFDGPSGIVFFGFFHEHQLREIVARVRFLLNNIDGAYKKIQGAEAALRDAATKLFDQISVDVLVPDNADKDQLLAAINNFQPTSRRVAVTLLRPCDLLAAVEEEYHKIGL